MPGQPLQTTAFVLARQPSGSDAFEQVTAFSPEHGVLHLLRRVKAGKGSPAPLDLFDEADLSLESSSQGRTWFIKEHRHLQRHEGIGRSYDALRVAAAIGTLVTRNPVSDESRHAVAELLRTSLGALAAGHRPDIVWLKSLYLFLRDEGYPVKQQWWPQLVGADQEIAAQVLNRPLATQTAEPPAVARVVRRLEDWVRAETELRL